MSASFTPSIKPLEKALNTLSATFSALVLSGYHCQKSRLASFKYQVRNKRETQREDFISAGYVPCPNIFSWSGTLDVCNSANSCSADKFINQTFLGISDTDHRPVGIGVFAGTLHKANPSFTIDGGSNPFFVGEGYIEQLKIVSRYFWDTVFPLVGIVLRAVFAKIKRSYVRALADFTWPYRLFLGFVGFPCSAAFSRAGVSALGVNHPRANLIFGSTDRTSPQTRLKSFDDFHGGNV